MKRIMPFTLMFTVLLQFSSPVFAQEQNPRLITVTGSAEVMVVPNEVILTLGVENRNKELGAAKMENDKRVQKVINVAQKHHIDQKYIKTDYINIEPQYDYMEENRKIFTGYLVNNTIVLTIIDTAIFEDVLADVLEAGANSIHGVQFRTSALRTHQDEARILAVKAAKEKAAALAKELGQSVGKPYAVVEHSTGNTPWIANNIAQGTTLEGGMGGNVLVKHDDHTASNTTLALGQIKVSARITVSFELE
ncbi:SIMPL domain-containing protein [Desulfogranum japonicum]|uniref:SIMPL domain-containing protein n=1 Tax=Desulfogranum japonicum TaxID=231447 RepID=UPI000424945D|nr:SIMPL domain-containing protein [Desulfogranum japonicum]